MPSTPPFACLFALGCLLVSGCASPEPAVSQAVSSPDPNPQASDPSVGQIDPSPAPVAEDRDTYEKFLPVDWTGRFGPEVIAGGSMAGIGWFDATEIPVAGFLDLSGHVTLTWLATSPTDRELYLAAWQVGCMPDPCANVTVATQGPSPLLLAFSFNDDSESLRFAVGSARVHGVQASTSQEFHLDGLLRSTHTGSPPTGTMVARVEDSWTGGEELTTTGPDCRQAVHGGFSHFDGVEWALPGTWEGLSVRANRLAISIEQGPTTPLACYRLLSPERQLLWQGSASHVLAGDFGPGNYTLTAALTGVGAGVRLTASADLVVA